MPTPQITAHFEQIETKIHNELLLAKSRVKLCIAWMAWDRFAWVFDTLLRRRVEVSIVFDDNPSNKKSPIESLPSTILRFPVKNGHGLMHNKFCIIDDEVLITGSYNWSANAWNHFENIVVVKNDFRLIRAFLHEFEDLKAHSRFEPELLKTCSASGCRSHAFNWAIMDEGKGLYETVELAVWEVCAARGHAYRVGVVHIDHLETLLGLVDQPEYEEESDVDEEYSKARMLHDFKVSRDVGARFAQLVESLGHNIHAVGQRIQTNSLEVMEYNESPNTRLFMHWRHMHHRKRIPQVYPQDDMESEDADRLLRGY